MSILIKNVLCNNAVVDVLIQGNSIAKIDKNIDFNADKIILEAAKNFDVILFDCVTIYLSNFLCNENLDDDEKIFSDFEKLIENLIDAAKKSDATIIFVSNEVGAGIVPENKLARKFRDLAGLANQKIKINFAHK